MNWRVKYSRRKKIKPLWGNHYQLLAKLPLLSCFTEPQKTSSVQQSFTTNATMWSTLSQSSALSSARQLHATLLSNGIHSEKIIMRQISQGNRSCCRWISSRNWHSQNRNTQLVALHPAVQHSEVVMTCTLPINVMLIRALTLISPFPITSHRSLIKATRLVGWHWAGHKADITLMS